MIALIPDKPEDLQQLTRDLEHIQKERPVFVAFLKQSLHDTLNAITNAGERDATKQIGAMTDLRELLNYIAKGPQPDTSLIEQIGEAPFIA